MVTIYDFFHFGFLLSIFFVLLFQAIFGSWLGCKDGCPRPEHYWMVYPTPISTVILLQWYHLRQPARAYADISVSNADFVCGNYVFIVITALGSFVMRHYVRQRPSTVDTYTNVQYEGQQFPPPKTSKSHWPQLCCCWYYCCSWLRRFKIGIKSMYGIYWVNTRE